MLKILFLNVLLILPLNAALAASDFPSCECPKVLCEPCFEEQGIKFYSEKCGEDGSRVRSCAKPTCNLMEPLPNGCEQAAKEYKNKSETRNPASSAAVDTKPAGPEVSLPKIDKKEIRGPLVAEVKAMSGKAWLKTITGKQQALSAGTKVHEKDSVSTGAKSFVKLEFFDGNEINITEKSEVSLETYETDISEKKRAILNLLKGRMRSKVRQKYDGKTTYFRVKTKTAVAGVRGTDFVVSYSEGERIVTEVSTFEGEVKFAGGENIPSASDVSAKAGEQVSFVIAANSSDVFSEDEMKNFVSKGYMTPVYKMTAADISKLEAETDGRFRDVAAEDHAKNEEPTCFKPNGNFNQCLWTCENNPKGSKKCQTHLPNVQCVRKRCNANGSWSDDSRLPASFFEACNASAPRVGPCDY